MREMEDIGDAALNANEVKALATGDPLILDKAQADADLNRLERLKRAHDQTRSRLRDTIRRHERGIEGYTAENDALQRAIEQRTETRGDAFTCVVRPRTSATEYSERIPAGEALREMLRNRMGDNGPGRDEIGPDEIGPVIVLGNHTFHATVRAREGARRRLRRMRAAGAAGPAHRTQALPPRSHRRLRGPRADRPAGEQAPRPGQAPRGQPHDDRPASPGDRAGPRAAHSAVRAGAGPAGGPGRGHRNRCTDGRTRRPRRDDTRPACTARAGRAGPPADRRPTGRHGGRAGDAGDRGRRPHAGDGGRAAVRPGHADHLHPRAPGAQRLAGDPARGRTASPRRHPRRPGGAVRGDGPDGRGAGDPRRHRAARPRPRDDPARGATPVRCRCPRRARRRPGPERPARHRHPGGPEHRTHRGRAHTDHHHPGRPCSGDSAPSPTTRRAHPVPPGCGPSTGRAGHARRPGHRRGGHRRPGGARAGGVGRARRPSRPATAPSTCHHLPCVPTSRPKPSRRNLWIRPPSATHNSSPA